MKSKNSFWLRAIFPLVVIVLCSVVLAVDTGGFFRILASTVMVIGMPGYYLTRVLWPDAREMARVERLALVLPASLALVGALLLLLRYLSVYTFQRAVLILGMLNGALVLACYLRPAARGADAEPSLLREWRSVLGSWGVDRRARVWHVALLLSCLALVGSVTYAVLTPRQSLSVTEFYALPRDGASPLRDSGPGGQDLNVRLGIVNHEGQDIDYRVAVTSDTRGQNTQLWSGVISVPDGERVENELELSYLAPDVERVSFLLYRPDDPEVYRSLVLIPGDLN